jgi:hypothetical protein
MRYPSECPVFALFAEDFQAVGFLDTAKWGRLLLVENGSVSPWFPGLRPLTRAAREMLAVARAA